MSEMDDLFDSVPDKKEQSYAKQPRLSKEEWAAAKQADREEVKALMGQAVAQGKNDPVFFQKILQLFATMENGTSRNCLLALIQKDDAVFVRPPSYWKERKIYIKPNQKAHIFQYVPAGQYTDQNGETRQSFDVCRSFDITQTNAALHLFRQTPQRTLLNAMLRISPVKLALDHRHVLPEGIASRFVPEEKAVLISPQLGGTEMLKAVIYEVSRAQMHKTMLKYDPTLCDFNAKCAAYIFSRRNGLDAQNPSLNQSGKFLGQMDEKLFVQQLDDIRTVANHVDSRVCGFLEQEQGKSTPDKSRQEAR